MSFYLDRLRKFYENAPEHFEIPIGEKHYSHWVGYTDKHTMQRVWTERFDFFEEEYKGFQIVILAKYMKHQDALDVNGLPVSARGFRESEVASHGAEHEYIQYSAYAYEIGTGADMVVNLTHSWQFSILNGGGYANDLEKTFKHARKRLEIRAMIKPHREELAKICTDRLFRSDAVTPYNAVVGDQVYIQAFSRLRKGLIVSTTGSKFIVAYMTPSNIVDLKWKTLPLSHLYVKETK